MSHFRTVRIAFLIFSLTNVVPLWATTFAHYETNSRLLYLKKTDGKVLGIQQSVCIYEAEDLVGCGVVAGLTAHAASIRMASVNRLPVENALVTVTKQSRQPTSTEQLADTYNNLPKQTLSLALGITAGFNYYYPDLHVQLALGRDVSIGLQPMFASYSNSSSGVTAFGSYLTATYYYTHAAFRGFMFEGGAGLFHINANTSTASSSQTAFGGKLTTGWRGHALWDLGLDIGVEAGFQYVSSSTNVVNLSFSGFLPLISAYVAYSF